MNDVGEQLLSLPPSVVSSSSFSEEGAEWGFYRKLRVLIKATPSSTSQQNCPAPTPAAPASLSLLLFLDPLTAPHACEGAVFASLTAEKAVQTKYASLCSQS